jgi:hypothetical protein
MPQLAFGRPLGEAELFHRFRSHSVHPAARRVTSTERIAFDLQLRELLAQAPREVFIETRANLSRVHELSPLVISHQQGPEPDAVSWRVRLSPDYELLFFRALKLQPIARSLRDIYALAILGDDPFPSSAASLAVIGLAFRFTVLGKSQRGLAIDCLSQEYFPAVQRKLASVVAIEVQEVEDYSSRPEPRGAVPRTDAGPAYALGVSKSC